MPGRRGSVGSSDTPHTAHRARLSWASQVFLFWGVFGHVFVHGRISPSGENKRFGKAELCSGRAKQEGHFGLKCSDQSQTGKMLEAGRKQVIWFAFVFQMKMSLGRHTLKSDIAWISEQLSWALQEPGPRSI